MRLKFTKLKGMELLAESEGRLLGSVRRLHIDSRRKMAVGLVFRARRISREQWAKVSAVNRVGEDVIFLSDTQAVQDDVPGGRDVKDMLGLPVTSLDGKRLGTLNDIILETEKWSIVALALDNGGEVDLEPEAVFGEDTILLQKGAAEQVRPGSSSHSGFLSKVFSSEEDKPNDEADQTGKDSERKNRRKPRR